MASVNNYITYAQSLQYEPQSLYLEGGQAGRICVELKELGSKRILIISKSSNLTGKNIADFIHKLEEAEFRIFNYNIKFNYSSSSDIIGALNEYLGYNCDTIVVLGGAEEVFCAKMVSAMAVNNMKDPVEAEGYGKIKKDISLLCCVSMDNSTAISSNIAEFRDEKSGRWVTVMSEYLVPQIVVIDTDIAMRTVSRISLASAFDSLAMGIECCLSPAAAFNPAYKACAKNAICLVTDNILDMKNNLDDGFLRKKIAVAGIYAGMAVRYMGLGYSHLTVHSLKSMFGPDHGKYYCRVLAMYLKESFEFVKPELALIYNDLVKNEVRPGMPVMSGSPEAHFTVDSSAQAFLELMDKLYEAAIPDDVPLPEIPAGEIKGVCESIKSQAAEFGLLRFDEDLLTRILERL